MPVEFTLDDNGFLQWTSPPNAPLAEAEAHIVASAEMAQALRFIGEALHEAVEAINGKRQRPVRPFEPM